MVGRAKVQHHNGVFRSIEGSASWQEVTTVQPSTFGFAVDVHPTDPDTAWFVPAVKDELRVPVDSKVVVARTRNGGESFDVLRNGLPQEHAYDLTYRHALDIDDSGDRLAFGSRFSGKLSLEQRFPLAADVSGFVAGAVTYLSDRKHARKLGIPESGNGRRESFRHLPVCRMTTTMIAPGAARTFASGAPFRTSRRGRIRRR